MISTDVMHEYSLYAGLPLFAFIVLLASATCLLLCLGAYYLDLKARGHFALRGFFRDARLTLRWPAGLVLATAVFLISNHLLVRGLGVGLWDADNSFYPYYVLVADYARAGRLLYWDVWSKAGLPILSDPQFGIFSPINFIVGFMTGGTSSGFIFYWLLMWWLGGFGMFMLARHLKAPAWGGCIVALGFLFCGAYTGNAEHTPWITSFSFLPLIIWRLDCALLYRQLQPAVEAGALWGLSALAGYPGLTILTGCFSALWVIGRWLWAESSDAESVSNSGSSSLQVRQSPALVLVCSIVALMSIVGLVVLSPAYAAFFVEGAGTHERVGALSREWALLSNALHPGALSTFASPYLTVLKFYDQMSGANQLWSYTDVSSASIYCGAIILVLAILALWKRPWDRWRWWLAGLGLLSLACALGQALPVRGWLYDWFYPMRFFRNAAIFRFYYLFAIAVLALIATRDLAQAIRQPISHPWKQFFVVSACVTCGALLVFLAFPKPVIDTRNIVFLLGALHAFWIWVGISGVAFVGWMVPSHSRQWCLPVLLLALAGSDAFLTTALSKPTMVNTRPEYVKRWQRLDAEHSAGLNLTPHGLLREEAACYPNPPCKSLNNDQVITKIPVLNSYTSYNDFHREIVGHPVMKKQAIGTERIWFSKDVARVLPTQSNFMAFMQRTEALGETPVVVHSPEEFIQLGAPPREDMLQPTPGEALNDANADQLAQIGRLPAAERIAVDSLRYLPDELAFIVHCPTDGWLLVTDRWARNWRAEVNGRPSVVYGGNFIFRAVQVMAGANQIRFTYHPFGFPWLVIISWGTLATVAVLACCVPFRLSSRHRL